MYGCEVLCYSILVMQSGEDWTEGPMVSLVRTRQGYLHSNQRNSILSKLGVLWFDFHSMII